ASQPVGSLGSNLSELTLPAGSLATRYDWYVTADQSTGTTTQEPTGGAAAPYSLFVADTIEQEIDNIEGSVADWAVDTGAGLTSGAWEQATPIGTTQGGNPIAPSLDGTQGSQNTMAWVTQNGNPGGSAGAADIDGGHNRLLSPVFDMAGTDGTVSFKVWYVNTETILAEQDELLIEITNNNGATWIPLTTVSGNNPEWVAMTFQISDFTIGTNQMRVRFTANDNPNNSLVEAGVDNWIVSRFLCDVPTITFSRGDVNADSNFDVSDPVALLDYVFSGGTTPSCLDAADANDDGGVNIADAVMLLESLFGASGTQPAAPFPACGEDPTDDSVGCDSFPACP
ncbi:MAG: dockerin type I repeat-containing protein, partial [Planctomycetota bacterium]